MQSPFLDPSTAVKINGHSESYGMTNGSLPPPHLGTVANPYVGAAAVSTAVPFSMMPQPFITIQVQVPSQLLPGRQMMVPVGPGCNIPVIVPQGVQGGMVIPVTIPNLYAAQNSMNMIMAPNMSPGQHHIPFGAPPMQHHQQPYKYYDQSQSQSQLHHPEGYSYPTMSMKEKSHPNPESWAAKVAAGSNPAEN
jgi:hypothetical protein